MKTIEQLKVQAYDIIKQMEYLQAVLIETNKAIQNAEKQPLSNETLVE